MNHIALAIQLMVARLQFFNGKLIIFEMFSIFIIPPFHMGAYVEKKEVTSLPAMFCVRDLGNGKLL